MKAETAMFQTIQHTLTLRASPRQIYETLLDSERHAALTGACARIEARAGGLFTAFDGLVCGCILELVPDRAIVQAWRCDHDWPEHHFAVISIRLEPAGDGTRLLFTQSGVPTHLAEFVAAGWVDSYWKPMEALFNTCNL